MISVPENFQTLFWVVTGIATVVGSLFTLIYFGWWLNMKVMLLETRLNTESSRLTDQKDHEKKLLDLEYQKAKVMNDQIIAASKE